MPPELSPSAKILVAAEAPGGEEVDVGRPLVGPSGQEVMRALVSLGMNRDAVSWSNATLCRPPGNNMELLLTRMKRENKEREAQNLPLWLSPVEACRPRFVSELRLYNKIVALGKVALGSIIQQNKSIMDMRGMPISGTLDGSGNFTSDTVFPTQGELLTKIDVMPTVHPAFVLRKKRWRHIFRLDFARAIRWFTGQLKWKEPQLVIMPSPDELEHFLLRQKHPFVASDVETDAKEPLVAKLRCVGVGNEDVAMVAGLLSIDGQTRLYPSDQEALIEDILVRFFRDPSIIKVGHNFNYYDRIVIRQQLGVDPQPIIDTIVFHRGAESELPHNLGFVGSVHTDVVENWKGGGTAVSAKSDYELHLYNSTDVVVDARLVRPLYRIVAQKNLLPVMDIHHKLQEVCVGLHTVGMNVDQTRRREHDRVLREKALATRQEMRVILQDSNFNPNSRTQVADVLFNRWKLTPDVLFATDGKKLKKAYTESGDPSTGDDVLRAALMFTKKEEQKAFLWALRRFRGAVKLRGTNIIPLRPSDEPAYKDDLAVNTDTAEGAREVDEFNAESFADARDGKGPKRKHPREQNLGKLLKPGLVMADGRVHPHYNAHATTSQRLSSSEPNGQNWSRKIRDIVCAATREQFSGDFPTEFSRALLAADMDQLELRFGAALAGAARYLEVFASGGDPHAVTCDMIYGATFKNASESDRKRLRDFGKRFSYAVLYRATVETVHETLASSENDAGELVFPNLTLKETRLLHERWLKANPEIERWWDHDLEEYRRQGYLLEPVFGWRRDFLDGEDINEIANFKCQAGGSAIVHIGTLEFLKHVPFEKWGPGTGLIQQGHDALMVEVPAEHPPYKLDQENRRKVKQWCPPKCGCITRRVADTLQECMTIKGTPFGLPVTFTAGAKIGFRWSDV